MNSQSIETFYSRIGKRIKLFAAFTGSSYIDQIIKMSRLKPANVFVSGFKHDRATLEKIWVDEFDNRLILKGKKIQLKSNCQPLDKPITDIYRNQTFEFILKNSLIAIVGLVENRKIVILWGSDNYLRCYRDEGDRWIVSSPICAGIKILKFFWSDKGLSFEELGKKCDVLKFRDMEWFRVSLPVSDYANKEIRKILSNGV